MATIPFRAFVAAACLAVLPVRALAQTPAASPSPAPQLHTAMVTCTGVHAWIWNRFALSPNLTDDAPFLMGSELTVIDGINPAVNAGASMYYETTIPIIELGPNLLPHYYVPRACVTLTGTASPAPPR